MHIARLGLIALLCACALLFTSCTGAGGSSGSSATVPAAADSAVPSASPAPAFDTLVLGYSLRDGFNPYVVSSSLVTQNAGLLFEKLVEIGPDMSIAYRLASSVEVGDTEAILYLRPGCLFADGTEISAGDVAASIEAARASSLYGQRLANVLYVRADGETVRLGLATPDSLFVYLLDLPVLKQSEAATSRFPTASGRYAYTENKTLQRNGYNTFKEAGPAEILLVEADSYDQMEMSFSIGNLNLYCASETAESAGSFSSQQTLYRSNHLVYIGINAAAQQNSETSLLATPAGRHLLSGVINRRQLAEKSYYQLAYPALGALNSVYPCALTRQTIAPEAEHDAASIAPTLSQMGYQLDAISGYYETDEGERLSIKLLAYSGSVYKRYAASLLSDQMAACGIQLVVEEVSDFEVFTQKIAQGEFDLYIGEVKLYNNMDMAPFLADGAASVGIVQNEALTQSYAAFKANQGEAGAFETAFAAEMPYIPLLWRYGRIIHSRDVTGLTASLSNAFYSMAELSVGQQTNS